MLLSCEDKFQSLLHHPDLHFLHVDPEVCKILVFSKIGQADVPIQNLQLQNLQFAKRRQCIFAFLAVHVVFDGLI